MFWVYSKADWEAIKEKLQEECWDFLDTGDPSERAERLTRKVLELCEEFIPKKSSKENKSTHPWLTEKVMKLVAAKEKAEAEAMPEQTQARPPHRQPWKHPMIHPHR